MPIKITAAANPPEQNEVSNGLLDVYRSLEESGVMVAYPTAKSVLELSESAKGRSPPAVMYLSRGTDLFINATWRDLELYRNTSLSVQSPRLVQSASSLRVQPQSDTNHTDLIQHFQDTAYLSLVTYTATNSQIRDTLMRMARAHNTAPGLALFSAMLAFSSLHRSGLHRQTVQLKISALQFLSTSTRGGPLSSAEAAQHAAASMLLGAFEILLPSESSGEWLWYIWGAMNIIQVTSLKDQSHQRDIRHLLDWVYYHNTLCHFTIHHRRHKSLSPRATAAQYPRAGEEPQHPSLATYKIALPSPSPTHAILNLLSDVCERLLDPWDPRSRDEDYHNSLKALERRAEILSLQDVAEEDTDIILGAKIWQMATRVYLARASQNQWEPSTNLDSVIDEGFVRITSFYSCRHFFPMFILSCEARTDERRAAILDLISRTERSARTRSLKGLRDMIQSIWVQQDLHADSDLLMDYHGIISTVISSSTALLSFA
ncbi:zinc-finger transcription factor [Colletotrichum tofieldiae]|uniref:Zinc-finger transcription factor n=1 Tax=Colletotrichum tofieldiae TaxID=708197 RepID=A0A166NAM4_9PEZI|nr:zinc-finger transcription factor [Colletotrichum tofieldiae]